MPDRRHNSSRYLLYERSDKKFRDLEKIRGEEGNGQWVMGNGEEAMGAPDCLVWAECLWVGVAIWLVRS